MFREPEGGKVVETGRLESPTTDTDEANMDVQKGSGANDASRTLYNENPTISVALPKPISLDMNSRSILSTKTPSFVSSNV